MLNKIFNASNLFVSLLIFLIFGVSTLGLFLYGASFSLRLPDSFYVVVGYGMVAGIVMLLCIVFLFLWWKALDAFVFACCFLSVVMRNSDSIPVGVSKTQIFLEEFRRRFIRTGVFEPEMHIFPYTGGYFYYHNIFFHLGGSGSLSEPFAQNLIEKCKEKGYIVQFRGRKKN